MKSRLFVCLVGLLLMLLPVGTFAEVMPYPPYPGAVPSQSYKVTVNGQPVFVHQFPHLRPVQLDGLRQFRHDRKGPR